MNTINISLPEKLKQEADAAVKEGYFASFSDFARTAFRKTLSEYKLDRLVAEAKREHKAGKTTVLKTDKDIENYFAKFDVK